VYISIRFRIYFMIRAVSSRKVFTPLFWIQRVFSFPEKIKRVSCKFTHQLSSLTLKIPNKCDLTGWIELSLFCSSLNSNLKPGFFLQRNILDKRCALQFQIQFMDVGTISAYRLPHKWKVPAMLVPWLETLFFPPPWGILQT
jgi:hypothetical protein